MMSFDLGNAELQIQKEKVLDSKNLAPYYLSFNKTFFNVFFNETKAEYLSFISSKSDYEKRFEVLKANPYASFSIAELNLETAVLRIKFGEYLAGVNDICKAYRILNSLSKSNPSFLPGQIEMQALKALFGSIPTNFKWVVNILGFDGDMKTAMSQLEILIQKTEKSNEFKTFAPKFKIVYAELLLNLMNQPEQAWTITKDATKDYQQNPLSAFCRAILAIRMKKNDEAIMILAPHVKSPPQLLPLDYLISRVLLQKLDPSSTSYLARFISRYNGENYLKDCYLKLGWAWLINNNKVKFSKCMALVKTEGVKRIEEDISALHEAEIASPDVSLLSARLLFDGGYYVEAKQKLSLVKVNTLLTTARKEEYYYRLGRITEALKDDASALSYYQKAMTMYKTEGEPYAPAACLYTAMIWERKGDKVKATTYYKQCLNYKNYPYKNSYDTKAFSGLQRLK